MELVRSTISPMPFLEGLILTGTVSAVRRIIAEPMCGQLVLPTNFDRHLRDSGIGDGSAELGEPLPYSIAMGMTLVGQGES